MKERSLIAFTLLAQTAVGAFWTLGALYLWSERQAGLLTAREVTGSGWPAIGLVMLVGILVSFFHLGDATNCWRTLANLRSSWLSREILLASAFASGSLLFAGIERAGLAPSVVGAFVGVGTALVGLALVYAMGNAYRLRTIPVWDSWATPASFFAAAFLLGPLAVGALALGRWAPVAGWARLATQGIALWAIVLLVLEVAVVSVWLAEMSGSEAARSSALRIVRKHGSVLRWRLALLVAGAAAAGAALLGPVGGNPFWQGLALLAAFAFALLSEVLGRALFYATRVRHGV